MVLIRQVTAADAQAIADTYNYYIEQTTISFEEQLVTAADISKRIQKTQDAGFTWLVAEEESELVGYAYTSSWKERAAYKHTIEVSVYLANGSSSRGIGRQLYEALFASFEQSSVHVVMAVIALPNPASIALHEKFGMKKVAHFTEVGKKFDRWIDVGYWQLQLDSEN